MEFKEELELLLNNFIITKENNKDDYYKVKSKIKQIREFTTSKLGCDIIINSSLIKLEKIPSMIDNTFKIENFDNIKDYIFFILLIMFLEEKTPNEQFILSNLTNFIINTVSAIDKKEINIDFKDYTTRKSLVDTLKYAIKIGIIRLIDGNDLLFKESVESEALYENTGISHYIMRQFKDDIFTFTKPTDFLNVIDSEDILNKKRYSTYRTLLFYPNYDYSDFDTDIYNYFINYRSRIINDLNNILDGDLLIYDNVALLTTTEKNARLTFPNSRKVVHDIILLVNDYIINEIDNLKLTKFEFEQILIKIKEENNKYFSKEYREMKHNKFFEIITNTMEKFKLLKIEDNIFKFSPVIYLISGNYPKEDEEENNFEQLSIEVED